MPRASLPSTVVLAATAALLTVGAVGAVGCTETPAPQAAAEPPPAAPVVTCAADERVDAEGACELFAATAACGPGTRPAIGSEECIAVGPTACAPGFEKDASGWGCAPVLPEGPCSGATRPRLGDRACVPVGDCSAAFPPQSASVVVDPALADAAVDATHVRTLSDALAVANDGAMIALADGVHVAERTMVTKAVTIAGRCAAKVHLAPVASGGSGFDLRSKVRLRGVTLDGYVNPLVASGAGSEVLGEDLVIEGARSRAVFAKGGSTITLRRSVLRGTAPMGATDQTVAVLAGTGARIALEETAILSSTDAAVAAADSAATRVSLSRCVVQETKPRLDGKGGGALRAFEGAHLDVTESAVLGSWGMAILALRRNAPPPEVTVVRSVIRGNVASNETGSDIGTAVNAAYDALVRIDESTISDSEGIALYAAQNAKLAFRNSVVVGVRRTTDTSAKGASAIKGAELTLTDSAIVRASGIGLGVWDGGHVKVTRSLVRDVGADVVEGLPVSIGLSASLASTVDVSDSAVVDALEIGMSATTRSVVHLDRVLVTRSEGAAVPRFGHGVLAVDAATFSIVRSVVERQGGVGLFFSSGGGVIARSLVRDNAVGAHVQETSSIVEADAPPDELPSQELVVVHGTSFLRNATRIGSGVLPLPAPLALP